MFTMNKNIILLPALLSISLVLTGCTNGTTDYAGVDAPSTSAPSSESNNLDLGEGDREITIDLPDFADAGEEAEPTAEAWKEFAAIADNSKFKLLKEGGYEHFGMYDESYFMIYDPKFPAGEYWTTYYFEKDQTVQVAYNIFEMAAFNAGIELFIYGPQEKRALSGSTVSKNPDGTYTVKTPDSEGYSLRYNVKDGLIIGRAVWEQDGKTFMGYTSIKYGLSENDKATAQRAYALAVDAGEKLVAPAPDELTTAFIKGSALTGE